MRDADSRFAGSTQRAGILGRLLLGGSEDSLTLPLSCGGSSAPAIGRLTSTRIRIVAAALSLLGLGLLLFAAAPAHAAYIHKPAATFNTPSAYGKPNPIAVDEASGTVYIATGNGYLERYDADGNPVNWPGLQGPNEEQTVHFEGFSWETGNSFTLTCPNGETTATIEWNQNNFVLDENINAALVAKCGGTYRVESGPYNPYVVFEGTFGHTNVPQMTCTTVTGPNICKIQNEKDGSAETNALKLNAGGSNYYQIAVDNTGGPNQGVIYISTLNSMTTCCPQRPSPQGGIDVLLPSGEQLSPDFEGKPQHPYEYNGTEYPGAIYVRSQTEWGVRSCGVAVDENGDLIVAHGEGNTEFSYLDKLQVPGSWEANPTQEPQLVGTINSDTSNPCKSQVDSNGFIYTQTGSDLSASGQVRKRDPSLFHEPSGPGRIPTELRDPSTLVHQGPDIGIGFDSEDNLFALRPSGPGRIQKLDPTGAITETFGSGEFYEPVDIAVNKSTGTVYVTDRSFNSEAHGVHIFKAYVVPNAKTGAFVPTGQMTGVLHGEAEPGEAGEEVEGCEFEFTTESQYNSAEFGGATKIPCAEATPYSAAESVTAPVSGLTLEQPYVFRLVTEGPNGASNGTVHRFVPHAVIGLETEPATNVGPRSATLHGSFEGNGDATEYYFEYGHGNPGVFTEETEKASAGSPGGHFAFSLPVSGLELETTYHFRVVAVNGTGTSRGFEQTFTTPPAVANLTTKPATEVDQSTVTLNASFTGDGHDTHYYFEYGKTKEYGQVSDAPPGKDAPSPFGPTNISSQISDFYGYTTYHYRVVAENGFGKTYGKDLTFSTEPAPVPSIIETTVSEVTPTTATFSAMVAPNRWDASWLFEWGEEPYERLTEFEEILAGPTFNEFESIAAQIEGLKPATVYHYRAVAFNFTGVTNGPDQTFRTPDAPKIESAAASSIGETTAHLSARVNANSSPTQVHFDFGTSTGYGTSTTTAAIGSDFLAHESAADLTGLKPGTTYHYRVVGVNAFGTTTGKDQTFTTQAAPTVIPKEEEKRPRKCPKGKVRRHGKCVPKHKHPKRRRHHHRNGRRHG